MKQLQNNFTTPEQSRRLLELGVPADSADCVLENLDTAENGFVRGYTRWIIEDRHVRVDIFNERNKGIFLPCWSVGRLIEIMLLCYEVDLTSSVSLRIYRTDVLQKDVVNILISDIKKNITKINFSKLEELSMSKEIDEHINSVMDEYHDKMSY